MCYSSVQEMNFTRPLAGAMYTQDKRHYSVCYVLLVQDNRKIKLSSHIHVYL